MDYKEKLKEALNSDNTDYEVVRWIEQNFPELKESGDERIRKALKEYFINSFQNNGVAAILGVHIKDILIWLEKQGEHANFINKIQIGDKVTRNEDGVLVNLSQLNRVAKKQGEQKPAWKPSEEQMVALERCVDYLDESDNEDAGVVGSLCHELKLLYKD